MRFVGNQQRAALYAEVRSVQLFDKIDVDGKPVLAGDGFVDPVLDYIVIGYGVIQYRRSFIDTVYYIAAHHAGFGNDQVPTGQPRTEIVSEVYHARVAVLFVQILNFGVQFVPHSVVAQVLAKAYDIQIILQVVYGLIAVFAVNGIIISRIAVKCGVQVEYGGIGTADTGAAVIRFGGIGHGFQRLPFVQILPVVAYQPQVVYRKPTRFGQYLDVIIAADAHKQVLCGRHIELLFVDYGDTVLVIQEEHVFYRDTRSEIEYDGNGFVQFNGIYRIAFQILQVAYGIHRKAGFQFVYIEHALFETDLSRNGTDQFVHAEEVFDGLVGRSHSDDVGFESRPGIFHQRAHDIGKSQYHVIVLGVEIVAHIGIKSPDEVILANLKSRQSVISAVLADIPVQAIVLQPNIAQFFDGVGGIQTDVVGVNVRQRSDGIFHHHVQIQAERAPCPPGPPAVIQKLFAYVLIVIQRKVNVGGFGQDKRRVQSRFVPHKRSQQHRKIDFFGRRKQELTLQVSRISHDVPEFLKAFEAGENYPDFFADMLGIQVHSQNLQRSRFGNFLVAHFGGGIHFQLYRIVVDVIGQVKIRFFYQFLDTDARYRSYRLYVDIELVVQYQYQLFHRVFGTRFRSHGQDLSDHFEIDTYLHGGAGAWIGFVLHRRFHVVNDDSGDLFELRFLALRRIVAVQDIIHGNDDIFVYQIEQFRQRIRQVETVPIGFRQSQILYLNAAVQILDTLYVHVYQFVLVVQPQHQIVRRQVAARHIHFVYRVVVFVHVRPQQDVQLQSQHRNKHVPGVFVIAVGIFGVADFVERDVGGSSDRIPCLGMQIVRDRDRRTRCGIALHVGTARSVYDQRRHNVAVVQVFVGFHYELHVGVYRSNGGVAQRGNQKAQVLIGQRVQFVLERREYAVYIVVNVGRQLSQVDRIEEYCRFVAVYRLLIVVVDSHIQRVAQRLERGIRRTAFGSGAYQRFQVKAGDQPDDLLEQNGVTEVAEDPFRALQVQIQVVTVVHGVTVYAVKVKAYQHFVGRAVVPFQDHVGIADTVVMYRQSLFVHQRQTGIGIQNDVTVGVLYFVRVSVQVGLQVQSERGIAAGSAFRVNSHVRADVITGFGGFFRIQVVQQILHRIDGFVYRLIFRGVIQEGIVVRTVLYRVTVNVRRIHGIAGDQHRRQQCRRYDNQCDFQQKSFHFASVRLFPAPACPRAN